MAFTTRASVLHLVRQENEKFKVNLAFINLELAAFENILWMCTVNLLPNLTFFMPVNLF